MVIFTTFPNRLHLPLRNEPLWYLRQCVVRGARRVGLVPAAFFTGPNAVRGGGIGFGTASHKSGRDGTESLSPQMA